jgi:Zn-dependent protease
MWFNDYDDWEDDAYPPARRGRERRQQQMYYVEIRRVPAFRGFGGFGDRDRIIDITPRGWRAPWRISFSDIELHHLLVAVLVLTIAFSLFFVDGIFGLVRNPISILIFIVPVAFVVVSTGFLLHELAHKVVAQRYGCWAEFRYFPMGLLFALLLSLFGWIFAAPGAVYISGYVDREQNGKISAAGPLTNLIIAVLFLPLLYALRHFGFLGLATFYVCWVNVLLGGFNMIPFMPFDGAKVLRWDIMIYIILLIAIIAVGICTWTVASPALF